MKETAPKVSIIMPCLNEERFIGRAIESLVGIEIASPQERLA
jgi:glycosyltransferase involved in cell wall biosynthesis